MTKRFYTILGVFLGILIVLFGLLNKKDLGESSATLKNLKDPAEIANNISANLNIQIFEKQELLEIIDLKKRLEKIHQIIEKETSVLSVEKKN